MSFPQLQHSQSLWEQVYAVLEEQILRHELAPGTRLVETELASKLGISRNPVREAMRALEQDGWVERGRNGMQVPYPGGDRARDLFEVRRLLEADTAGLAAQRRNDNHLADLEAIVDEGWATLERGDPQAIVELNAKFHGLIATATGNVVLAEIQDRLDKRARWHFKTIATARGADSWTEHRMILDALRAQDSAKSSELARHHVEQSAAALQALESGGRATQAPGPST